ncbi:MAG: asparaginase [Myxococcales bacterium]|nr:asparaginase [Myxococcales bacterium]
MSDALASRFEGASLDKSLAAAWAAAGGGASSRLTVVETRGDAVEGVHEVAAALCDASGTLLQAYGPADPVTTWRSAAKPFQLAASLDALGATAGRAQGATADAGPTGGRSDLAFNDADLALGAASHSGQAAHVEGVRALLSRFGLSESCLACGAHAPVHGPSAEALLRTSEPARAIHNNCSGKHTFMVAATVALGADPGAYLDPEAPIQRRIAAQVASASGAEIRTVTDGCGAPCFVLPLSAMARAYARLAEATSKSLENGAENSIDAGAPAPSLLGAIGRAMSQEPWWMSGDGRLDLELVRGASEPLVSKVGAAGVLCVALPRRGLGLALKVLSGSDAARPVAARLLLEQIAPGLLPPSLLSEDHLVRNVAGHVVGKRRWV